MSNVSEEVTWKVTHWICNVSICAQYSWCCDIFINLRQMYNYHTSDWLPLTEYICSDNGQWKSSISIKWWHFLAWLVQMKLGGDPLSAWRLWLIKADQHSMSWQVFSSLLWKFSTPDAALQLPPLFFHNWPLGDWQRYRSPLRNVTYSQVPSSFRQHRISLAHVLPIALFFNLSLSITIK